MEVLDGRIKGIVISLLLMVIPAPSFTCTCLSHPTLRGSFFLLPIRFLLSGDMCFSWEAGLEATYALSCSNTPPSAPQLVGGSRKGDYEVATSPPPSPPSTSQLAVGQNIWSGTKYLAPASNKVGFMWLSDQGPRVTSEYCWDPPFPHIQLSQSTGPQISRNFLN